MKKRILAMAMLSTAVLWAAAPAMALEGAPMIHDPSTIMESNGKYFTFGTGSGGLMSEDGWTWTRGGVRPGGGAAPDAIKIGDRYLVVYGATGGGLGGGHNGRILTMWNKSLDPEHPDFGYSEAIEVASSDGIEDCDAIDPGVLLDPTTGRLWCCYGTFFGNIRLIELDPETGARVEGNEEIDIAIDCEATTLMYRDGWYYLLGVHGTCCSGANSTYNIRVGRSKSVTGPYVDHTGMEMLRGGGKLVIAANNRNVGPGHFGLIDLGDDVQKFSMHYEADLDRGGSSVLAIRSLVWEDGWPEAGDDILNGSYQIQSERSGYALEMGVQSTPLMQGRGRGGFGGFGGGGGAPAEPVPDQVAAAVSANWPDAPVVARLGDYMLQAHQKWTIEPVEGAKGYLGTPSYKIVITGTNRALTATDNGELIVETEFTGDDHQLWRLDQLTDRTYRIMPKVENAELGPVALVAMGVTTPTLAKFDPESDFGRWNIVQQ